jgi:hypothetical protein
MISTQELLGRPMHRLELSSHLGGFGGVVVGDEEDVVVRREGSSR